MELGVPGWGILISGSQPPVLSYAGTLPSCHSSVLGVTFSCLWVPLPWRLPRFLQNPLFRCGEGEAEAGLLWTCPVAPVPALPLATL